MSEKKILEIVGDFVEDYEVMVPYQALEMVGHEVHAACPEKDEGDVVKTAVHDFRGDQTYLETRGHDFGVDVALEEIDPADYDALVVPGGRPRVPAVVRLGDRDGPALLRGGQASGRDLSRPADPRGRRRA
ncbi:intracellular protease 1 [Halolamina pelagica]|uniref:Intracellular protease 1 n=1 Tax=Halolamina pelagica TaxID=699431 RepID=A0A0P7HAE1_9EURY|nr:intracellular protease 1 [Halolamina pelagica]